MKPFLRPTDRVRLAPVGWTSEAAGVWAGRQVEVVFDPRQHQVAMIRNNPEDTTRAALAGQGFRRLAVDGEQEMWVRDRIAAAERSPEWVSHARPQGPKGVQIGGRGL